MDGCPGVECGHGAEIARLKRKAAELEQIVTAIESLPDALAERDTLRAQLEAAHRELVAANRGAQRCTNLNVILVRQGIALKERLEAVEGAALVMLTHQDEDSADNEGLRTPPRREDVNALRAALAAGERGEGENVDA
jgi:hypothetical protein